ncbi:MAG TPA: alpha/beta fold hydrolase [Rubrivivax sp.]|jgi:pimeloyl-ACP methyl ester carboxylesterase|nr:alpha/beta fold hydrolase [Rubrivivax sp.]
MKALALKLLGALLFLSAIAMWLSRAPDWPVESLVARWAPAPSDFIDVKGQLVHLRDVGPRDDPTPIVLVHGTSASLHTWEGWAAALRTRHRVISFDLPGFGLTGPSASADYRGDTYARFVLDLMNQLKVQRFVIAGNSLGGEVAWRTALLAPQRVTKLILVDAIGPDFKSASVPTGFLAARLPVLNRLFDWVLPRAMVVYSLRNVYGDPAKVNDALVDRYYQLTLREGNRRALVQRLQQHQPGQDAERIRELTLPTLILWGGRDRLVPPSVGRQFQDDIAGSERVVFDELGHVPHEEDAARTVGPVKAFLQRP